MFVGWSFLVTSLRDLEASHIGKLFTVVIVHGSFVLVSLFFLGKSVSRFHCALLAFRFTVSKHLLTAHVLSLQRPQLILLFLRLLQHFVVLHLELALMFDGIDLLVYQTLEMVGLYAMRSKHGLFGLLVLRHEVMSQREMNLICGLSKLFKTFCIVLITLLFGQLGVRFNNGLLHSLSFGVVCLLRLLEHVGEMVSLLLFHLHLEVRLFFQKPLFALLLINPVSLL